MYTVVLSVVPLALYLLLNPMFVFERYFIFALPFILLIIGSAVAALAERLSRSIPSRGCFAVSCSFFFICSGRLCTQSSPRTGRTTGRRYASWSSQVLITMQTWYFP